MATNIQWILYRNPAGRVLVKVLFNEQEVKLPIASDHAPYYDWEAFKTYCADRMESFPNVAPALP